MSSSAEPPFEPRSPGISLDELAEAFAQVMGTEPRQTAEPPPREDATPDDATTEDESEGTEESLAVASPAESAAEDDPCPISPRAILEAILFVGNRENQPISPHRAAALMRDVTVDEIPSLIDELNQRYDTHDAPYHIVGEGDGYRLTLRREFHSLRSRFHGRIREARLSQVAIDVLALVAYQQPLTSEKVSRLRGRSSSHILSHLVRRGLLRIERPDPKRRTPHYYTTDRFLRLFNLESLEDLPQSEDPEPS